ncbi:DUF5131 family protein [Anabaena minutissima FACHB-250]|nr:DUF5131 family protein [Anabaena minutissima FACHB-250]
MTNIQWTDITSNPIHLVKADGSHGGHWCKKVSPGCANCYSEVQNNSGFFSFASHLKYIGEVPENLILDESVLQGWLKLKKPHKIFVCSMTDIFGEWVKEEWIDKIFAYMAVTPHHTYQLLTKRPEIAVKYFADAKSRWYAIAKQMIQIQGVKSVPAELYFPLDNIWIGTSCENQAMADKRIPLLLDIPAKIRFLSCEPLLESIDLLRLTNGHLYSLECINLVIVGGESGRARDCKVEWVESIVEQCEYTQVRVFVKQLGSNAWLNDAPFKTRDRKGGNISEFPVHLQVRELPQ